MFEGNYPGQKVQQFFRYIVNAAAELEQPEFKQAKIEEHYKSAALRVAELGPERRDELNVKVNMYYTKNYYLPFENRLKKLQLEYQRLKRSKKHNKKKLDRIQNKIKKCEKILQHIHKLHIAGH